MTCQSSPGSPPPRWPRTTPTRASTWRWDCCSSEARGPAAKGGRRRMATIRKNQQRVSVPRAAAICGLSPSAVRAAINRHELPAVRPNKHLRVKVCDALDWLEGKREFSEDSPDDALSEEARRILA